MIRTYEPITGYSVPVVRVLCEGVVLYTLSFTLKGDPINLPAQVSATEVTEAWRAWEAKR